MSSKSVIVTPFCSDEQEQFNSGLPNGEEMAKFGKVCHFKKRISMTHWEVLLQKTRVKDLSPRAGIGYQQLVLIV